MSGRIGPKYPAIVIGTQTWMLKNLDVTRYRNGDPIPQVTGGGWELLTTGAWCYYDNDPANGPIYGKLYNWYAVNDPRGLAPQGWHIPTETEWNTLINYLGGSSVAGGAMKETGFTHWFSPNTGATNSSGFTALAGGARAADAFGTFSGKKSLTLFLSSTSYGVGGVISILLSYNDTTSNSSPYSVNVGMSVRCIKD